MNRSKFLKTIGLIGVASIVAPKVIAEVIPEPERKFTLKSVGDIEIHKNGFDGVLLIPQEAMPDNMTIDEVSEQWNKTGVVTLKHIPNSVAPKFIKIPKP